MKSSDETLTQFEVLDGKQLAARWQVNFTWIRKHVSCDDDPLPHVKLGRYVRFLWGSPDLNAWLARRYVRR
jgi:hypothetical protein